MATDHNFKIKKGLHVLGTEGIYLTDTNTRIAEGSGNSVRIITGTGHIDIGSMNSGWVHMQANKNIYILPSSYVSIDGNLQPYTDSARNLGADGTRWSHIYGDNLTVTSNIRGAGIYSTSNYTEIGTTSSSNLVFKRNNASYIQADQSSGYFIFITNGRSTSYANRALAITTDNDLQVGRNVVAVGSISGASGSVSGKFAVMNNSTHASYDFYNNGTTYLNGITEVNAEFKISSSSSYITHFNYQDAGNNIISQANGGSTTIRNSAGNLFSVTSAGDVNITDGDLFLGAGSGQTFIEIASGTSNAKTWRIYNGISWNPDALLIYNHTNDSTALTIEPGKLGINRGASSLIHALDVGGNIAISGTEIITSGKHLINIGTINTGQGATEVHLMNQNVRSSDSPTFQDLTIQGNLSITGDINSYNVTDLDVVDKTITLGVGGTSSANNGGGIIIDGASAKLTWSDSSSRWTMNKSLQFSDTPTTTNQAMGVFWPGFDKEATSDYSDNAKIIHTTNTGGHTGSVLLIESQNDANDGIAFVTNASSPLKHNSSNILTAANFASNITSVSNADTVDSLHASSFLRSDTADTGSGKITLTATEGLEVGGIRGRAIGNQSGDFIQLYERVNIGYPSGWGASGANAPTQGLSTHGGAQFNVGNVSGAPLTFNGNTIWHAGNDGSGSGLDADTLDGKQGSDLFNFGYAYSSNTLSRAVGSGAQWYKVASFSGGVKHITMKVHSSGDNTTGADVFFISCGSYGMKAQIVRMPSTKYNGTKLEEVRTKYVSGATYEIWVKVASITSSVGYLQVFMNDSGVTSSLSAGTEPSVGTADATLPFTASDRINYSLQATSKVEAMGGFVVDGSTVWHAGNDGPGSGLDADTLDGVNSGSFLRSDAADTSSATYIYSRTSTTPVFDISGHAGAASYNYFMRAGNDGGNKAVHFVNGSTRSADHGANAYVIRNDGGIFVLGKTNYATKIYGNGDLTYNDNEVWHAGNDGSGSGLDADTVDGYDVATTGANKILRTDGNNYIQLANWINIGSTGLYSGTYGNHFHVENNGYIARSGSSTVSQIRLQTNDSSVTTRGYVYANSNNYIGFLDNGASWLFQARSNGQLYRGNGTGLIWDSANDGSGSGLDADLLDGQEGSYYRNASNINAGTLPEARIPTISKYLRSDTDDTVTAGTTYTFPADDSPAIISTRGNGGASLYLGGWSGGTNSNNIHRISSSSNLHIDSAANGNLYLNYYRGGTTYIGGANVAWHAGNDGSGSGLDADTVDGIQGASFLRSDAADSGAGSAANYLSLGYIHNTKLLIGAGTTAFTDQYNDSPWYGIGRTNVNGWYSGQNKAQMAFYWGLTLRSAQARIELSPASNGPINFGDGGTTTFAKINSTGIYQGTSNLVWHAGNDGSGSGLDADLLDGQHGSYYAPATGGSYLPLAGGTVTGDLIVRSGNANAALHFRTGNDFVGIGFNRNVATGAIYDSNINAFQMHIQNNKLEFETYNGSGGSVKDAAWVLDTSGNQSITGTMLVGGQYSNNSYSTVSSTRLLFGGGNDQANYHIGTNLENYGGNYTKLDLRWHTGIRMGAQANYGGIRFFNNEDLGSVLFSIGKGDGHTRVESGNLYFSTGTSNIAWHAGNDGSGSGLDADTLDGQQGTNFKRNNDYGSVAEYGPWYSTGAYVYDGTNGTRYFWNLLGTIASSSCRGTIEYEAKDDENYPNFVRGLITYSGFNNQAFSIQHDQSTQDPFGVQVRVDTSRRIWIRTPGVDWAHYFRFRVHRQTNNFTVNTSWSTGSTRYDTLSTSVPPNSSNDIMSGQNLRATTSSVTGNIPSYSNFNYFGKVYARESMSVGGNTAWHAGNDGSGSGLDADLLDGLNSNDYLRLDGSSASPQNVPANKIKRFSSNDALNTTSGSQSSLEIYQDTAGADAFMTFHVENDYALYFGLDGGTNDLAVGGWSKGANSYKVWHQGNDGDGSGLDAGLLSGMGAKSGSGASGSNQIMRSHSNGYLYMQNWIDVGAAGLFSSSTNGAHFKPNGVSSYGTWASSGSKGGYDGLVFDSGGDTAVMFDSAGNGGFYRQGSSRWYNYHHVSNGCTAFNSSTTSSSYVIYVHGAIYSTADIVAFSDRRAKENIITIDSALEKVNQLRGVYYNKIDNKDKKREIGFIAQEVNEVAPELVTYAEDVDEYGMKYGNTTALLVEAVKELTQQVKDLKQEVEELKNG